MVWLKTLPFMRFLHFFLKKGILIYICKPFEKASFQPLAGYPPAGGEQFISADGRTAVLLNLRKMAG
jgi:hypothetical protein